MRLRSRPTLQTLLVILLVFAVQQFLGLARPLAYALFVLDAAVTQRPWAIVTSVYAHNGLSHLVANTVALLFVGPLVALRTTTSRFHAYFLGTGAISGLAEVTLGSLVGPQHAVLGASGAILALLGYLLSGNVVSTRLLDRIDLSGRAKLLLLALVVGVLTLATSGPESAVIGHATGLACGLVAGRLRLLDVTHGDSVEDY